MPPTAKRSRTGCQTCRQRKLKCDELKPICGQCSKSRRECIPSDGLAFRHEQNAGLNSGLQDGERSLGNFYKYRVGYSVENLKNFVPIPATLGWILVTDVYADDVEQTTLKNPISPQAYQREVASHSLEALSTAAAENQAYQPPVTYAEINNFYQGNNGGYGPAAGSMQGPTQNHNIKFLLNPSSNAPPAMIDPNLDTEGLDVIQNITDGNEHGSPRSKHGTDDKIDEAQQNATEEQQVAFLLKNYDEQAV